jgi:hypothetical protein
VGNPLQDWKPAQRCNRKTLGRSEKLQKLITPTKSPSQMMQSPSALHSFMKDFSGNRDQHLRLERKSISGFIAAFWFSAVM